MHDSPQSKVLVGFDPRKHPERHRWGDEVDRLMSGFVLFVPKGSGNPRVAIRAALLRRGFHLRTRTVEEDGVEGYAMWRGEASS